MKRSVNEIRAREDTKAATNNARFLGSLPCLTCLC